MLTSYKLGTLDPDEREWIYENVWATEETTGGSSRLVIAPTRGQTKVLTTLLKTMTGPFWVLYVLVVFRGGSEQGRYQSANPQTKEDVEAFLNHFSHFLETDGRHHLWIASESGSEMLIYDRHNVIYAYNALDAQRSTLADLGLNEVARVRFPSPHSHHYHQGLDHEEARLLGHWEWVRTPLRESDEE